MRRVRTLAISAAVALCLGCTPMQWVKADATPEQLNQDTIQCQQDAWREARLRSWNFQPLSPVVAQDASGRRMLVWPSSTFYDPFRDPFLEESRLSQLCMRSKGYQRVPVEPKKAP